MVRLLLAVQAATWTATPIRPTVGDTVWLERVVAARAGWEARPGRLGALRALEPLAAPVARRARGGWLVRYAVVAWTPGRHTVALPPIWRLGPDGTADSLEGGSVTFTVARVIPDTVAAPAPRAAAAPLRPARRTALPAAASALAAGLLLVAGVRWRRRPRRAAPDLAPPAPRAPVPDARWLAAGEPKAVAARAAAELRGALARAVPAASVALSTAECLAVLDGAALHAPLQRVTAALRGLEQVEFAAVHGGDVATLAGEARALGREVAP